jgi:hypothetical protein
MVFHKGKIPGISAMKRGRQVRRIKREHGTNGKEQNRG